MLEPQQLFTKNMLQDLFFRHSLLFNHDFAKALWGEDKVIPHTPALDEYAPFMRLFAEALVPSKKWQHHLQQMVIAEDPIKYLGEHLND